MVASDVSNQRRAEMLGMPFGTAAGKLRKSIIMFLAQKLGMDECFKCGGLIERLEDWSIEHKKSWYRAADPRIAFFDLENIAFSHIKCNTNEGGPSAKRKIGPEETSWCGLGKHFAPIDDFNKNNTQWDGLNKYCKPCFYKARKYYPSRNRSHIS